MALSAQVMAAVASPRRREILRLTWTRELAAGEIHRALPGVTFGAVSMHLRALADAGLVSSRAEGRFRYYRANQDALGPLGAELEQMWAGRLWRLQALTEMEHARRGPRARTPGKVTRR
ncbi:MAG: transcriptional regulator [Acidimicrobiia bacterium]